LAAVVLQRHGGETAGPRSEPALLRALGRKTRIQRRPDGKPEAPEGGAVSAAHAGELTLAVAGQAPLACDLETVAERSESDWRDVLGAERFELAAFIARTSGETLASAAIRVWSALECLKKAGLPWNAPLICETVETDGWIVLGSGSLAVATYPARLTDGRTLGVAVLLPKNEPAAQPARKTALG
jgi:enediyne polyketide synthase